MDFQFFRFAAALAAVVGALASTGCTIVSVDKRNNSAVVEADGFIEGHIAVGLRDENRIFDLEILGGTSRGSVFELVVWRLFRVEIGVGGASLGLGPLDMGAGVLWYHPRIPTMLDDDLHEEEEDDDEENPDS